jgi:hypothetical protein
MRIGPLKAKPPNSLFDPKRYEYAMRIRIFSFTPRTRSGSAF